VIKFVILQRPPCPQGHSKHAGHPFVLTAAAGCSAAFVPGSGQRRPAHATAFDRRRTASRAGSGKALSTVTAIIDGMGSCGAALGPLLTGHLAALPGGFDNVFYMLAGASAAAAALLARLVVREARPPRRRD